LRYERFTATDSCVIRSLRTPIKGSAHPTAHHLSGTRVDIWEPNRYLRVLTTTDGYVLVQVEDRGTIDDPDLDLFIRSGNPSVVARMEIAKT